MSAAVLNRVWKGAPAGLTAYERLLLVRLAWYADDEGGNCYAAVSSLVRETCATDRGVRNAMRQLQNKGMILIDLGKGPRVTNRVALHMPSIESFPLNGGAGLNGRSGLNGGAGEPLILMQPQRFGREQQPHQPPAHQSRAPQVPFSTHLAFRGW